VPPKAQLRGGAAAAAPDCYIYRTFLAGKFSRQGSISRQHRNFTRLEGQLQYIPSAPDRMPGRYFAAAPAAQQLKLDDPYTPSTHTSLESPRNGGINGYFTFEHGLLQGKPFIITSKWGC
jgi:hypothetical protein